MRHEDQCTIYCNLLMPEMEENIQVDCIALICGKKNNHIERSNILHDLRCKKQTQAIKQVTVGK